MFYKLRKRLMILNLILLSHFLKNMLCYKPRYLRMVWCERRKKMNLNLEREETFPNNKKSLSRKSDWFFIYSADVRSNDEPFLKIWRANDHHWVTRPHVPRKVSTVLSDSAAKSYLDCSGFQKLLFSFFPFRNSY